MEVFDLANKKIAGGAQKLRGTASKKLQGVFTPNIASAIVYLLQVIPIAGLAAALVAYAVSKDEFVRHNAVQAFFFSLLFTVLAIVFVRASLSVAVPLLSLAVAVAFVYAAFKSFKGQRLNLPFVKEIAG